MSIRPWAPLPARGGRKLRREAAGNGDSRIFQMHDVNGLNVALKTRSLAHWIKQYSQGAITFPAAMNNGVGGDNSKQVLDRQTPIKALPADTLIVNLFSTNDRTQNPIMRLGQTRINMMEICRSQLDAGQVPLFLAELPRGPAKALTGQALVDHRDARTMILTELAAMGARVADPWSEFLDMSSGELCYPKPGLLWDDLHWAAAGGEIGGRHAWAAVKDLFNPFPLLPLTDELYDATYCPAGSRIPNCLLIGSGAAVGASVNPEPGSTLPPNFKVAGSKMSGITTKVEKRTRDVGESVVFTFSGTVTEDGAYLGFEPTAAVNLAGLVAGSRMVGVCGLSLRGDPSCLLSAGLELQVTAGSTYYLRDGDQYRAAEGDYALGSQLPNREMIDVTRETPVLTFDASITAVIQRLRIYFRQGSTVNCSVEVYQFQPRQLVA